MQLRIAVTLSLLGVASPAFADPMFEAALGYRWGGALIDGVNVHHTDGAHVDAGVRLWPRLLLYGEYDLMEMTYPATATTTASGAASVTPNTPTGSSGLEHRVGANARYTFEHFGGRDGGMSFWAEGGPGVEHYVWDTGGVWTRPDFEVGLGTTLWFRSNRHHYDAWTFAIRGTFAPKNNVGPGVSCGGPCDTPTTASIWDRSLTADVALAFGR